MGLAVEISDAFELGWAHIRTIDKEAAREEIMNYFRVTSDPAWLRRLRGEIKLDRNEARDMETIFSKYGVEPEQIWGRYES